MRCSLPAPSTPDGDAAHKRLIELLDAGKPLPCELRDQIIYYVGPTPGAPGGYHWRSGPTTSYRMDAYAPRLMAETGLHGMIGKGPAFPRGGRGDPGPSWGLSCGDRRRGALLASTVRSCEMVAYPDLQSEAIRRLEVVDFPAVVVLDCEGNNLYESGRRAYLDFVRAQQGGER